MIFIIYSSCLYERIIDPALKSDTSNGKVQILLTVPVDVRTYKPWMCLNLLTTHKNKCKFYIHNKILLIRQNSFISVLKLCLAFHVVLILPHFLNQNYEFSMITNNKLLKIERKAN